MKDYSMYTNEELVNLIRNGEEDAYEQLFYNLMPVMKHEALMYLYKMDIYDMDDFLQEGRVTVWKTINKNNYDPKKAKFSTYFGVAYRRTLIRIYADYTRKNLVCIGEQEDFDGTRTRTLIVSDYAKEQRAKANLRQKRYMERKKARELAAKIAAGEPVKEKKPPMTKEERNKKVREYQKKYYAEHPEKLEERREKNRKRMREIRAKQKAEKLAMMAGDVSMMTAVNTGMTANTAAL